MGGQSGWFSCDNFFDSLVGERSVISLRRQGQVLKRLLQCNRGRTVASTIGSMTTGAVLLEDSGAIEGDMSRNILGGSAGRILAGRNGKHKE
jgi:hypothetical protein